MFEQHAKNYTRVITYDRDEDRQTGNGVLSRKGQNVSKTSKAPSKRRPIFRFSALSLTTILSIVLLVAHVRGYKAYGAIRDFTKSHQATTQLVVQVIANILAVVQVSVLCELINIAVRMRLRSQAFTISNLHFWISISQRRMDWNVRARLLAPVVLWVVFLAVPAALWAGALAPVSVLAPRNATTTIAAYSNTCLIQQYDNTPSPEVQNELGFFTYAQGDQYAGQLLETARSTKTPNNRNQSKLDDTHYIYRGRSYGVGGSVGLFNSTAWPSNVVSYTFRDTGYVTQVECIYNSSSSFYIERLGSSYYNINAYAAKGYLPNSDFNEDEEYITYVGMGSDHRVIAISVARAPTDQRRIMAIAAGRTAHSTTCSVRPRLSRRFSILMCRTRHAPLR